MNIRIRRVMLVGRELALGVIAMRQTVTGDDKAADNERRQMAGLFLTRSGKIDLFDRASKNAQWGRVCDRLCDQIVEFGFKDLCELTLTKRMDDQGFFLSDVTLIETPTLDDDLEAAAKLVFIQSAFREPDNSEFARSAPFVSTIAEAHIAISRGIVPI